jgi:hypothetical protein
VADAPRDVGRVRVHKATAAAATPATAAATVASTAAAAELANGSSASVAAAQARGPAVNEGRRARTVPALLSAVPHSISRQHSQRQLG